MFSLSTFCCVCLHDGEELQCVKENDYDSIPLASKLKFCALPNDELAVNDVSMFICIQCCHILRLAYNFKRMCIKHNYFIKGYVSKLKNRKDFYRIEDSTNISLQKLKDYVDNIPLSELVKSNEKTLPPVENTKRPEKEKTMQIKKEKVQELEEQENGLVEMHQNSFEPEIYIEENETPIKIDIEEHPVIIEKITNKHKKEHATSECMNKEQKNKKRKKIKGEAPLSYTNDYQEKSSTQTLEMLKLLVHGTNSAAVDKLKQLVSEPIPEVNQLNHEFQPPEQQITPPPVVVNNFETIYVKPEPLELYGLETSEEHNISEEGEMEDTERSPGTGEMLKLLDRDDNFCPICNKTFLCKSYYERHITMHTGIKNYQCYLCQKRFTRKSTLKTHTLSHTGPGSFACPICCKIFTQKGNMKSHMAIHFPDSKYECLECGKRFALKSNLKVHTETHDNSRKPQCPMCQKRFLKNYLPLHMVTCNMYHT